MLLTHMEGASNVMQQGHTVCSTQQLRVICRATRDHPDDIRDEGLCLYAMQQYADSAEVLQQYLAISPSASDALQVNNVLDNIYRILQQKPGM